MCLFFTKNDKFELHAQFETSASVKVLYVGINKKSRRRSFQDLI